MNIIAQCTSLFGLFLAQKKGYCPAPSISVGTGICDSDSVSKILKFYIKVCYVIGKDTSATLYAILIVKTIRKLEITEHKLLQSALV